MTWIAKQSVIFFAAVLVVGCGSSSDESSAPPVVVSPPDTGTSATDITDVLLLNASSNCSDYVGEYISEVEDIQRNLAFNGSLTVTVANGKCVFSGNEIPNHDFNDGNARFATPVSEQLGNYEVSATPQMAEEQTDLSLNTVNAILLNGVVVDLLAAACYGVGNEPLGDEKIGCGDQQIANPWRYDPMSSLNNFGTDSHNAHPQPDGTYHYHGNPKALFEQDCDILAMTSPVIGFAADGFAVFGPCINDNGTIRKAKSSYRLKDNGGQRQPVAGYITPIAGTGNIASGNYDGQFRGDYYYDAQYGDLDECNGMTINGQYGYVVTDSYPWLMACLKGTVDPSMIKAGAALQIRLHSHPH